MEKKNHRRGGDCNRDSPQFDVVRSSPFLPRTGSLVEHQHTGDLADHCCTA
jgi:hypothetical protein